jgi:23S rRNA pseudouridine1911/1915/1917 synthase
MLEFRLNFNQRISRITLNMNTKIQTQEIKLSSVLPEEYKNLRLDKALATAFSQFSREKIQQWIHAGVVFINGTPITSIKHKVQGGEAVIIQTELEVVREDAGQAIDLNIIYEDDDIFIINKPTGLVVHPGAGNIQGTLLNGLLHHAPQLRVLPRAGIVHRLDKNTSGLMVVAKTLEAYTSLVRALSLHEVDRTYYALVKGEMISGGTVNKPMARHPHKRTLMAVVEGGKPAVTHYRVQEKFKGHTLLRVNLETGRTHQIRVHLSSVGHPIIGDKLYGWRHQMPRGGQNEISTATAALTHQLLHAKALGFLHPITQQPLSFEVDLPEAFAAILSMMRTN